MQAYIMKLITILWQVVFGPLMNVWTELLDYSALELDILML